MKLVVLESPYAGDVEGNIAYAKQCIRDCLRRNESPIASHLLFTQPGILDDLKPEERKLGIEAGLMWATRADYSVFYSDRGWSSGMLGALHKTVMQLRPFKVRKLDSGAWKLPVSLDEDIEILIRASCEE